MNAPSLLDRLTSWLSPARRKAIYTALTAISAIVATLGWATETQLAGWVGLVQAVLALAGLSLAALNARSVDWKVLYVLAAAVVTAVKTVGLIDGQLESTINQVLSGAIAAIPLLAAVVRTDTSVSTGEPADELAGRLATQQAASPPLPAPDAPAVDPEAYAAPSPSDTGWVQPTFDPTIDDDYAWRPPDVND